MVMITCSRATIAVYTIYLNHQLPACHFSAKDLLRTRSCRVETLANTIFMKRNLLNTLIILPDQCPGLYAGFFHVLVCPVAVGVGGWQEHGAGFVFI